jgi:hypothetical protein
LSIEDLNLRLPEYKTGVLTLRYNNTKVGVPSTYLDNGGVFNDGTIQHFWGLDRLLVGGVACERLYDSRSPGFDLGCHEWVLFNRFRTTQGRCASLMHRWGYVDSPVCDCGPDPQTMSHIVNECPIRRFNGGLVELSEPGPNAISFLKNLDILL